jgi:hypothetical protein
VAEVDAVLASIDSDLEKNGQWEEWHTHSRYLPSNPITLIRSIPRSTPTIFWANIGIAKRTRVLQAGTIALSETKTEWHKHELRNNTNKVLIKAFGTARTEYGTSSDKFKTSNYKPGGTLYSALGTWAHIVCASGRDKTDCGRYTFLTYNARDGKKITVISAYRVGKPTSGRKTASRQQETIQYAHEELIPFLLDPYK